MKKIYITLLLSLSFLSQTVKAQILQEVIEYSKKNNYQLQILQEESEILSRESDIASTWDDPILKAGINDVQAQKPFSRTQEAMQNQFVAVSQKIPLSNHLKISSAIAQQKREVIEEQKDILFVNIAFGVRKSFIDATNSQKTLDILDEYIEFLKHPLELIINLSAIEKQTIERYIKTQLLQQSYRLQRENALQRIKIAKENIELIGNFQIESFSDEVELKDYHLQPFDMLLTQLLEQSPELKRVLSQREVATHGVALASAQEQADITVTTGFYQRFDKNDYLSFSISYPLFIRNKQSNRKAQAMRRVNIQEITYKKIKTQLAQGLKITLHQLQAHHQELEILEQNAQKIEQLINNAKLELAGGGSLLHYYELFTQKVNNQLAINKKHLAIALDENQIDQLLGVTQ